MLSMLNVGKHSRRNTFHLPVSIFDSRKPICRYAVRFSRPNSNRIVLVKYITEISNMV